MLPHVPRRPIAVGVLPEELLNNQVRQDAVARRTCRRLFISNTQRAAVRRAIPRGVGVVAQHLCGDDVWRWLVAGDQADQQLPQLFRKDHTAAGTFEAALRLHEQLTAFRTKHQQQGSSCVRPSHRAPNRTRARPRIPSQAPKRLSPSHSAGPSCSWGWVARMSWRRPAPRGPATVRAMSSRREPPRGGMSSWFEQAGAPRNQR